MNSLTEENYLKALFHLKTDNNEVTVNELSKFLNIKMPSVNSMMKKFAQKNWVITESYKPIILTEIGQKEAALVIRKHRLTEMFLVEKMGFGWENVHKIAEELEHIHSEEFFDKMDELLNYPKVDPHGEPIPDKEGNIIEQNLKKLSECTEGSKVTLAAVTVDTKDFLSFLNDKQLNLGSQLTVNKKEKFDASMMVTVNGISHTFSKVVCDALLVKLD
ncbi:metal-dependent transcriptional regulator [Riemerella anatipestifer]|uniref:Transcriptional regulator MntR n=3 Tax=Riemerella anatipestifer TaxID=34085 RepID=J9R8B3_RIEAN|nr:metal-dependent transcriptional regulator [Riemerella anatipestifer]ACC44849.1 transcriptional regulatory protein [Riemerella anatipestifer]ADQ81203.1 iron (metal) dependent repressor, DtxR family [Riemerella anatipestifer ATCC 11845 = DSM 15868]ADZ11312.1 Mn-dependent transcriptional regulator [Riemerella anatipestifer RA-GD]AFD55233.1 iron (metal) dependent repressor, dtxr family [Riemerella anatipestifer ATCC 11845 = DSM 15868]AFR36678.1 Mn-dependent transcriptional regulator [Riemerella